MSRDDRIPFAANPLRFSPIPVAVLRDDQIPHGAKVLLGVILDYAWSDMSTWVSVETLASSMRHGIRTIQMWLKSLKGHGWIRFEPDPSVKTGRRIVLVWREGDGRVEAGSGSPESPDEPGPGRDEDGRKSLRPQCDAPNPDSPHRGRLKPTTTDTGPEQARRSGDVGVGDEQGRGEAATTSRDTIPATPSTVEKLVGSGVTPFVAEELAREFGDEKISRQITALPYRNPKDSAATLVTSIRKDWGMPEELQRAEEKAARLAEERRRRAHEESLKQLRKLHEQKVAGYWASMTPADQERFVEEAIEHVVPEIRDEIRSLSPANPLYRGFRVAVRQDHIRRKLGLEVEG